MDTCIFVYTQRTQITRMTPANLAFHQPPSLICSWSNSSANKGWDFQEFGGQNHKGLNLMTLGHMGQQQKPVGKTPINIIEG